MAFVKDEEEEVKQETPVFMKSTEELKKIIGNFERELEAHKSHEFYANHMEWPDCGSGMLRDIGLTKYYLQKGWISTRVINGVKHWAVTLKYLIEGIPEKERAMDELISRRQFAEKCENEAQEKLKV